MEKFFNRSFEQSENNILIDKAFAKAESLFEEDSIKIDDFADYGEENIKRDKEYVEDRKKKFAKELTPGKEYFKKLATVFEAIVHDQSEQGEWLGHNATTIKTTDYDDIANGVDSIVEFREEHSASHLAMAIDATFNQDTGKKFDRIKNEIKKGELATIKYFHSEHLGIKGRKSNIPRVVVGTDIKTIKELSELWLGKGKENILALANHPIQLQILEEMLLQFETFKNYAQKVNQPEIAAIYEKTHKIVKEIYSEKKKAIKTTDLRHDDVFESIKIYLENFK